MTITQDEAETILKRDLEQYEGWVREYVRVEINDDQFSALVSFCYNLGPQSLKTSTLLEKLNAGNFQGAADEFGQWVFAGDPDQPVPGLVRRRDAERALFLSQDCYQYM